MGVSHKHQSYEDMEAIWKKCRDASAGQEAIHAGTTLYLPMLKGEDLTAYQARLARTPFYDATGRKGHSGTN